MLNGSNIIDRATRMLLVLTLLLGLSAQAGGNINGENAPAKPPVCKCCGPAPASCPSPGCCSAPESSQNPVNPSSLPSRASNEFRSVPPASIAVVIVTLLHNEPASSRPISLLPERPIPLFQRDCSYLI